MKATENFALSAAIRKSQARASPIPGPVDWAVKGGDYRLRGLDHPLHEPAVRAAQVFSEVGVSVRALDDLRQVGAGGEAPAFAPQDYAADLVVPAASPSASYSSSCIVASKAFSFLGRFREIVATPLAFS